MCTSSTPESWSDSDHRNYQAAFSKSLCLAEAMFSAQGLADPGEYRWQRALLVVGDYLLPIGRNRSFLTNAATEDVSWKRLLSGAEGQAKRSRDLLKSLFNKLSPEADIVQQLDSVIEGSDSLDAWRHAVVSCPSILEYCDRNMIRIDERGHIYLLKRSQMNGAHAELFTFYLYNRLVNKEIPLSRLQVEYQDVNDTYSEPHVRLSSAQPSIFLTIQIGPKKDEFLVYVVTPDDTGLAELLIGLQFNEAAAHYQRTVSLELISSFIGDLDAAIDTYSKEVFDV